MKSAAHTRLQLEFTERELTEARATIERLQEERDSAYVKLRCVSTENAPLRADAARYRWLRDNSLNNPNLRIKYRAANSDWTSISEIGELDSVIDYGIDAARAHAEKESQ